MAKAAAFVIIGASVAGAKAAETLRDAGFDGRITLIGDEIEEPYQRPPLSKGFLRGKQPRETVFVQPSTWYLEQDIDLVLGTVATAIDRDRRTVTLADGGTVGYDALLLTTGATPRRLSVPGAELDGVLSLRRLADSERIKGLLQTAERLAIVGGGWIGLEVAAAAREAGVEVTVLEVESLPLLRVLGPEIARVFADLHREHGVDLRTEVRVSEILDGGGRAAGVQLADGTRIEADAVLVGIGAAPNVELAVASGLAVDNGIVVDPSLRSTDPRIYAAGDVASALHPIFGKHIRVEHVDNARRQPAAAARAMLGEDVEYDLIPYFYSDQYDASMEYTGYLEPGGYDEVVVRGDLAGRTFVAFWLAGGRVQAGMHINTWGATDKIQRLVSSQERVDSARLADPQIPIA
jgi:3-phenylpropionate/trans-cinnamate dioxygenase ferredoxin reductase component